MALVGVLLGMPVAAMQIPEDKAYEFLDVVYLNKKLKEIQQRDLIREWSLSADQNVLKIEVADQWDFMSRESKAELARRLLSLFGYYSQNRDARSWNFSVVLERAGSKLAEDRGTWQLEGKDPKIYP